jgi:hypothetical protein
MVEKRGDGSRASFSIYMERFSRELCLGEVGLGSLERRMNVFEMEGEGCSAKGQHSCYEGK